MAEYARSRLVQASPDDVFAHVSDANNPATFMPTVDTVAPQAEGRVEVPVRERHHPAMHHQQRADSHGRQPTDTSQPSCRHHPLDPHMPMSNVCPWVDRADGCDGQGAPVGRSVGVLRAVFG